MNRALSSLGAAVILLSVFASSVSALDMIGSVGPGTGYTTEGSRDCDDCEVWCTYFDETWEGGWCWQYGGIVPPFYGAFAMPCETDPDVEHKCIACICFYFTQTGGQQDQTMDVYVWYNDTWDVPPCLPGDVACVCRDIDPGPIAYWPEWSVHCIDVPAHPDSGCCWIDGEQLVWIGYWSNWPAEACGWFIAADQDGYGCPRCGPMTNIAPGIGYPTGWQDINLIMGPTEALGIGACWYECGGPSPAAAKSWGNIKTLYR